MAFLRQLRLHANGRESESECRGLMITCQLHTNSETNKEEEGVNDVA